MAFVMPRFEQGGPGCILEKGDQTYLLIFAIGVFLNWSPFVRWDGEQSPGKAWENVRIFGVLQRIPVVLFCFCNCLLMQKQKAHLVISGICY